jgi:hypothetical protein
MYSQMLETPPEKWGSFVPKEGSASNYSPGSLVWGPNFSLEEMCAIASENNYTIAHSWSHVSGIIYPVRSVIRIWDDKETLESVSCHLTRVMKDI